MSAAAIERQVIRKAEVGEWPIRAMTAAQVLAALVALVGIVAWATLTPVFILTFLFMEPLLIVAMLLFVVGAIFTERGRFTEVVKAGTTVFRSGDHAQFVYAVRSGKLRAEGGPDNRFARDYGPGDYFGLNAAFENASYLMTVTAVTECELICFDPGDLRSVIAKFPALRETLPGMLDARLRESG